MHLRFFSLLILLSWFCFNKMDAVYRLAVLYATWQGVVLSSNPTISTQEDIYKNYHLFLLNSSHNSLYFYLYNLRFIGRISKIVYQTYIIKKKIKCSYHCNIIICLFFGSIMLSNQSLTLNREYHILYTIPLYNKMRRTFIKS